MKRKDGRKDLPGGVSGSAGEKAALESYPDFKEWMSRNGPGLSCVSDEAKREILTVEASRRISWFRRYLDQATGEGRGEVLRLMGFLSPTEAASVCQGIIESEGSRLSEKMAAGEILKEIDPDAGAWESVRVLNTAGEIVEAVSRTMVMGEGDAQFPGAGFLDSFDSLPEGVQTSILVELSERAPERSIRFLDSLLKSREDLWGGVLDILAENPCDGAAGLIGAGYERVWDKDLKKRMKKVNHKRRAKGWTTAALDEVVEEGSVWRPPVPAKPEGLLSISEVGPGYRMVWVIRGQVPRGMLVFSASIHDRHGILNFSALEMSRREAEKYRESVLAQKELNAIRADAVYCARLMEEAYGLGAPREQGEAETFRSIRPLLKELLAQGRGRHPVYDALQVDGHLDASVDPLGESTALMQHPVLDNWWIDSPQIQGLMEKLEEIQGSRIIVHPMQKQERTEAFYRDATREILSTPEERERWRGRVEDAALSFLRRAETDKARRLLRIGSGLEDPDSDISRIPFFLLLVRRTLERLLTERKREEKQAPSLIVKP